MVFSLQKKSYVRTCLAQRASSPWLQKAYLVAKIEDPEIVDKAIHNANLAASYTHQWAPSTVISSLRPAKRACQCPSYFGHTRPVFHPGASIPVPFQSNMSHAPGFIVKVKRSLNVYVHANHGSVKADIVSRHPKPYTSRGSLTCC